MYKSLILFLFLFACSQGPAPIVAGKDECSFCKMSITDTRFAAELITMKGKIYKFDDVVCMIGFINSGTIKEEEIKSTLVVHYHQVDQFVPARDAYYVVSEQLHSPMNGNAAALASKEEAGKLQEQVAGELLSWSDLKLKSE